VNVYLVGAKNPEIRREILVQQAADHNWQMAGFIDNNPALQGTEIWGWPVLGGFDVVPDIVVGDPEAFFVNLVTGSARSRHEVGESLDLMGCRLTNLIHPSVDLTDVEVGVGVYVQNGVFIQAGSRIADNVAINVGSVLAHESSVDKSTFIAPMVTITGEVKIGRGVLVGASACITPLLVIGDWATIGAGAVIIRDVEPGTTVVGVGRVISSSR